MLYEIMTVLPSRFAESELDGQVAELTRVFEGVQGEVKRVDRLGKLKLAYPIKRDRHGHYLLWFVEMAPEMVTKLDQTLRLSEDLLRHLVLARPEGMPEGVATITAYQPPLSPEGRRSSEKARPSKEEAPKEAGAQEEAAV